MSAETQAPARIMVVDDHPIVRLGIRQMIGIDPNLSVCCETAAAETAVRLAVDSRPDLVLLDLSLEHGSGLELIHALHQAVPKLPVLVLSMHDETLFAERTLRAGARGYIMKHEAIDHLVQAIHRVLSGQIFVSDRVSQMLLERYGSEGSPASGHVGGLTDRELEVFELVGRGLSTAAIAERLGVSIKTIETYRSNIRAKLHLKDATELVRYATSWVARL